MPTIPGGESSQPHPERELTIEQLRFQDLLTGAGISKKVSHLIVNDIRNASPRQIAWLEVRLAKIADPEPSPMRDLFKSTLLQEWQLQKKIY